jgi:inorganic pyrophosphatase
MAMAERMEIDVTVEIPTGSRNKYEWDERMGRIRLDRRLYTATHYPADYGFINETMSGDGDALDCLVLVPEPTFPGCLICSRPIGVFWMEDEKGPDAKILAVPAGDAREGVADISDLPEHVLSEISHFFQIYKDLEPGKSTTVQGWEGHAVAEREIETARERYLSGPGASRVNA